MIPSYFVCGEGMEGTISVVLDAEGIFIITYSYKPKCMQSFVFLCVQGDVGVAAIWFGVDMCR